MAACVRYIVNDVTAAIEFYTKELGFKLEMHPAPPFAEISRGDLHIYLTQPSSFGGGSPMPSGEQQKPGGWNRIHLPVEDIEGEVARLKKAGVRFRSDIVKGFGGSQAVLLDPSGNPVQLYQYDSGNPLL